ncbi:hypothetical protein C6I20_12700 [Aeromicrobium sp. A1-2]|uniref:fibrinogen-like YCDxxxxGGGW domain-containing protein n=1 Tax=Aeromicrobium sp. A1-2 TaxID=2107713 RepID=UPI000E4DF7EB|nr:fibrinogen-like YCDxxxxGGGW domain-containing protein [Aeromicrobium sp. A1-2]AXT85956.1 hypothetical protein C6I20_12700 [Aeromicrobium sp. A1-2]
MPTPKLRPLRPWLAVAVLAAGVLIGTGGAAQAAVGNDGTTQPTAAASCWEAKQVNSSAPGGVYWILTPQLQVPTEIYCDMTTDGGGWELVGRGRENWTYDYNGAGTPAQVAGTVTGTGAFSPRQLDANVINGLMGGRRFDSFSDGVRVRRATNQSGTNWQETRWTYKSRDRWTWALGAGLGIAAANLDGVAASNTTTYEFGSDSAYRRLWTYESSKNNYVRGFNFGQNGIGSTSASSYIYSSASNGYYGSPFSQVFIRPKLRTSDLTFAAIPSAGTAAQTIKAVPRNGSLTSDWGVTGLGAAGGAETASEVQAFAQIGNVMYVGGNFTTVQKGANATGAEKVARPYLAAFNATTGDYIPGFAPVLDNQVKSLLALPDGRLAVGGEFTKVSGATRAGLVVLNPTTGALDTSWQANVENRMTAPTVSVRGLDTDGTYLYLTGAFTHLVKPGISDRYAKGAARIQLSNGVPDNSWNPEFNGTGTALDVSDDKSRVYFSGYFTTAKGVTADRAAAFSTATGAPRITPTWQPTFSTAGSARYQQAIKQVGNKVWLGGSQHSMFSYNTGTFALENKHITKAGGDIQAIEKGNGLVFAGCHCLNWNYSDTALYDSTSPGSTNISWSQADKIFFVGAWDATTGDYVPDFTPEMKARSGRGAWALKVAADGTLWAGGTMTSAVKENGSNGWVGGFVRFAARPHTAPGKPAGLAVTATGADAKLTWSASSTSGVTYEVLRNDRVVATTSSTTTTVAGSAPGDRFFVRSADDWGNRSASTAGVTPTTTATTTLLSSAATWAYFFDSATSLPSTWRESFYDDSSWQTGTAPLGWGSGPISTNIDVTPASARALTSYHRTTFTIPAGAKYGTVDLTTRADDGVAVYVNGTEVGRSNLPAGTLTSGTYALSAPSTSTAAASPAKFEIPVSLLKIGSNSVAVEVHSNYRSTSSTSMDAAIVATAGANAPQPASQAVALVPARSTWSYLFDRDVTVPAGWAEASFDVSGWSTGAAPLGWGTGPIATDIDTPTTGDRALASYYRRTFDVADPASISALEITTRADDGVVVYVNGIEIGRSNLPTGDVSPNMYALSAPNTATAIANPVTLDVPLSAIRAGKNVIAVEMHSHYRSTPSASMDLALIAIS